MTHTRRIELHETDRVPWLGLILGWGAMLPFALCSAGAWLLDTQIADAARAAAHLWGGALLLFFSGVRRGLSFRTKGGPTMSQMLTFAGLFCIGLTVLLVPVSWGLGLITLTFAALAVADVHAAQHGEAPLYFTRLRPWQMTFATAAVALCWAAGNA